MRNITVMLKPASSACNMRCRYCFYADVSSLRDCPSYGVMTKEVREQVVRNIFAGLKPGDRVNLAFQGGEPTLAGLPWFRAMAEQVRELSRGIRVSWSLQTNGLLLDDEWCAFLKEHDFLVGLSLDGYAKNHNACRPDAKGEGTFSRVLEAKARMDRHGVDYNVLTVLTGELARHPQQVWKFLREQKIQYVQFIPCLGPLEGDGSPYALTPKRYAEFYTALWSRWHEAFARDEYISVKLFDDLVRLLAFGECNACGLLGACQPQLIVEADGGVYPCDFYVLDGYRMGDLTKEPLDSFWPEKARPFLERPAEPLPLCADCPYRRMCNGGCQRMRQEVCYSPGDTACGHRLLLEQIMPQLRAVAASQRGYR